jgi:8-oxo-dGTP pyrophosphatase MutT (NUDIX family)
VDQRTRERVRAEAPSGGIGEAAVAAILTSSGDILVVRRAERWGDPWSGNWALPGGFWRVGDSDLLYTARREVLEETGIDLFSMRLVGWLFPRSSSLIPRIRVHPIVVYSIGKREARLSDELSDYRWVPLQGFREEERSVETWEGRRRVPALVWEEVVVWGLTRDIVLDILGIASAGLLD